MQDSTPLQTAIEVYEDALVRGLCREGALEAALGAVEHVTEEDLLRALARTDAADASAADSAPPGDSRQARSGN